MQAINMLFRAESLNFSCIQINTVTCLGPFIVMISMIHKALAFFEQIAVAKQSIEYKFLNFFFKQFKTITNCSQTKQTKQTKATKICETKNSKWIHCFILCAQMPKMRNSLFYGAIVFLSISGQVYLMVMQFGEIQIKCCASWIKERWKYSENFQLLDYNITIGWDF